MSQQIGENQLHPIGECKPHTDYITSIETVTRAGQTYVITTSRDKMVCATLCTKTSENALTFKPQPLLEGHKDHVIDALVINNFVYTFGKDGAMHIWDVFESKKIKRVFLGILNISAVCSVIDNNINLLVVGNGEGRIAVFDLEGNHIQDVTNSDKINAHEARVSGLCYLESNKHVISGGWDGRLNIIDVSSGTPRMIMSHDSGDVCVKALHKRCGKFVFTVGSNNIRIFSMCESSESGVKPGYSGCIVKHDEHLNAVHLIRNTRHLVGVTHSGLILYKLTHDGAEAVDAYREIQNAARHTAVSPTCLCAFDGQHLACGDARGGFRILQFHEKESEAISA